MDLQTLVNVKMKATRQKSITIDKFDKQMCTKRLILEVCQVHAIADSVQVELIVEKSVCYVDMDKYGGSTKVQREAVECALTDYL
jgi:hypothetical protein